MSCVRFGPFAALRLFWAVSSLSLRVQQTSALHRDRLGLFGQGELLSIVAQPRFGIGIDQVAERPTLAWKRWFSDQTPRYSLGTLSCPGSKAVQMRCALLSKSYNGT